MTDKTTKPTPAQPATGSPSGGEASAPKAPTITPEGSREVDALSIIKSTSFTTHLKEIRGIAGIRKPVTQ